jgi:hypothetical protein
LLVCSVIERRKRRTKEPINRNQFVPVVALTFALIWAFAAPRRVAGKDNKTPYPRMASLDQYLMDRDAEIALARSAAPPSIASDATVMVLGKHGYETAVEGKNGFVCIVGRTWTDGFDRPDAVRMPSGNLRSPKGTILQRDRAC